MVHRGVAFGALVVLAVGGSAAGLWWQRARAEADERAKLIADVAIEENRSPIDRGALAQLNRRIETLLDRAPHPELLRARARVALASQLPEDAVQALEELQATGKAEPVDQVLLARALAARHAAAGRSDDAGRAAQLALDQFEAQREPALGLLAWQCASRIEDQDLAARAVERLRSLAPESFEAKVVAALADFRPDDAASVSAVRSLASERRVAEADLALALVDVLAEDEVTRGKGIAEVTRVLGEIPASKPARLVAVAASDRAGDAVGRATHLRWLLKNYPDDPRATQWDQMLQAR